MTEFRPDEILRVLTKHRVRFVLIGGLAAVYYGSRHVTTDVDITPEDSEANLDRLSRSLDELEARIRTEGEPEGVPFSHDGESLRSTQILNLATVFGDMDITLEPSGTTGYSDLAREAEDADVLGVSVPLASLADVIRSKEAAGRAKDLAMLPELREILEARKRRPRP